jgi:amino acid transporter
MAVVGGIIGGGIFQTPVTVAERVGSAGLVLLAWVAGGVVALIGAFCFGELGRRRPRAGGGYVYLRETWGPLPAFLYGWTLVLVIATGAIAAVAVTFANYALALLGLPDRLTVPVAVAAIVLLAGISYAGVRPAAVTQNVFTLLKLAALAVLIGAGLFVGLDAPTTPPPHVPGGRGVVGLWGKLIAAGIAISTFGFLNLVILVTPRVLQAMAADGVSRSPAPSASWWTTSRSATGSSSGLPRRGCSFTARAKRVGRRRRPVSECRAIRGRPRCSCLPRHTWSRAR